MASGVAAVDCWPGIAAADDRLHVALPGEAVLFQFFGNIWISLVFA